jgi:tetratricopeptide (TPR) repeat protein
VDYHPTPEELEGFVLDRIPAERRRAVIVHLIGGCRTCGTEMTPYIPLLLGDLSFPDAAPPPSSVEIYDGAVARAFAAVRGLGLTLPAVKTPEQKKLEALDLLAKDGLEGLQDVPPDLQGLPLCEALLERSWALRHEDPDQMVQLAQAATLLADRLTSHELGVQELADLRCRAWMELGNAYRVADELDRAADALGWAALLLNPGTKDDFLGARWFTAQASLDAARRNFDVACTTQDLVAGIYRRLGDEHLAGRALIMKGIFTGYRGDAGEAVRIIEQGLSLLDETRDPELVFSALQNQAWLLVDCGRFQEAQRTLWNLRGSMRAVGGRINELKVRWLEGHIFVGLKQPDNAERALRQVKQGFEETGLPYKSALAGLELAAVLLRRDRLEDAAELAVECTGIFLSLGIHREVIASLLVLRKAAEMRCLTLTLLQQVIDALHRAERDPSGPLS